MKTPTITIQISRDNNQLLNQVAELMCREHPAIWSANGPSRNAVVGFLAAGYLASKEEQ